MLIYHLCCTNTTCVGLLHVQEHSAPRASRCLCRWQGEEQPLAFKPERWLAGAALKQGAWIPFGGGQRLCLGWLLAMTEMKVRLSVRGLLGVGVLCVWQGHQPLGQLWSRPVARLLAAAL